MTHYYFSFFGKTALARTISLTTIPSFASLLLVIITLVFSSSANAQDLQQDPNLIKGPDACGECHEKSVETWKQTHHAKTFKSLPKSKDAKKIAKSMGIKRIKADSDCLGCHFTSAVVEGKTKPIAGITCESCHGAGKEWIDIHSDFGGKDATAESETPAHKSTRYAKAEAAGMLRPNNLYAVAANCYGCHTVPNEKLVNVGKHTAGSKFELVAWTQGEVRHNTWYTESNDEAPLERRRMMFIIGKMLDLEFAYRGLAEATEKADYAIAMAKRAKRATKALKKINDAAKIPEVAKAVELASGIKLKLNNKAGYDDAAAKISALAQTVASQDGSQYAAIDAFLPKAKKYKGKVSP